MNESQSRCLIAHMMYWDAGLKEAMDDVGISESVFAVVKTMLREGYIYNEISDYLIVANKAGQGSTQIGWSS